MGFLLRQIGQTFFLLYPDSYRYLWQAESIRTNQPLALEQGNFHLGYSFLTAVASIFIKKVEDAAHFVSFTTGVLAIPLIYFLAKEIFFSKKIGILASLFLAGSFNHSAWSGFVLAETSAIFFLLLAWVLLKLKKPFWAGLAQAMSIACRIEYVLLALPTLVFFLISKKTHRQTLYYLSGLGLPLLIFILTIRPEVSLIKNVLFFRSATIACLILSVFCFLRPKNWLTKIAQLIPLSLLAYSILLIPFRATNYLLSWDLRILKAWGDFALSDPLLVFLGLAGLALVISEKPRVGFFFFASTLPLFLLYQQANPVMHRYLVHLVPILAISAGYFTVKVYQWSRLTAKRVRPIIFNPAFSLAICLFVFGLLLPIKFVSANWHPEENYEQLAAYRVEKIIQKHNLEETTILITFSVAPYAFYTKLPVLRIAQTNPFIKPDSLEEKELALVVVDEAVRDQRPEFTLFAMKNLEPFLIEKSFINAPYLYSNYQYYPEKQVRIYLLPTAELEQLLEL